MKELLHTNKNPLPSKIYHLSEQHVTIINFLQEFSKEFGLAPSQRALINYIKSRYPSVVIDSMSFMELFPEGIAQACMMAGVPTSPRCL